MSKNNLNLNNKFGECCNCPALMSDRGRMFTNYVSSRIYNDNDAKRLKIFDANTYRENLQVFGSIYRSSEIYKYEQVKCKTNAKNKFYIDSSHYTFDKPLTNGYWGQQIQNDGYVNKSEKASF
jgi:hypothetical protein